MFLIKICAATCCFVFPLEFTTLIIALTGAAFLWEISIFAHCNLFQVYAIRSYIAVIHFVSCNTISDQVMIHLLINVTPRFVPYT